MAFNPDLINDVKKNADIVKVVSSYLNVTKKGKNFVAICPFHDDTNPSLTISPEKQIFTCFVCGATGNVFSFVQKYEHTDFMTSVKRVADIAGYHPEGLDFSIPTVAKDERKTAILKCLKDLTTYYQYALNTPEGKAGLDYLESRHLTSDIRNKYHLGYAFDDGRATCEFLQKKGHSLKTIDDTGIAVTYNGVYSDKNQGRVIFPIADANGNVIGFSARRLKESQESKYVNSPETYVFHKSSVLYNYHIAKDQARLKGYIYVCEGFMDVYALSRVGIDAAVALMGTAFTKEHIAMLRALNAEIRLCLDGDLPGQTAIGKAAKVLIANGLPVRIVDNQGSDKDPDEILNEDGPEALTSYLNQLIDFFTFQINYYTRMYPLKTAEEKKKLLSEFFPVLANIKNQLEYDDYLIKVSKVTGFEKEAIHEAVTRFKHRSEISEQSETSIGESIVSNLHPESALLRRLELAEKEMLYQMTQHEFAVDFYENKTDGFSNEIYRQIANFIIENIKKGQEIDVSGLITAIENSDIPNKETVEKELASIAFEKHHAECNDELLIELLNTMNQEKEKIFEKDTFEQSIQGKDPLEQARIAKDYTRRLAKKK